MPLQTASGGVFNLFVLHISSRTLYIVDQTPKGDEFKIQPLKNIQPKFRGFPPSLIKSWKYHALGGKMI